MIISATERGNFRQCKRLWDYSSFNRQSLTPIVHRPTLALGTLVHKSLAEWMHTGLDPQEAFINAASEMVQKISAEYRKNIGAPISQSELGPVYDIMQMGHEMVGNYRDYWCSPLPEGYTLIQPEQTCIIDIPNVPDNWHCKECGYRWWRQYMPNTYKFYKIEYCDQCKSMETVLEKAQLECTLDGFVANDRGQLFVLERKTFGSHPRLDVLQQNDQFLAYDWILHKLFPEQDVVGLLYDGLWKREKPPKNRTMDDMFLRHIIIRPQHERDEFELNLAQEYRDMMATEWPYPNRHFMGCMSCQFEKLCTAQSRGDDYEYVRRELYTERIREYDIQPDDE